MREPRCAAGPKGSSPRGGMKAPLEWMCLENKKGAVPCLPSTRVATSNGRARSKGGRRDEEGAQEGTGHNHRGIGWDKRRGREKRGTYLRHQNHSTAVIIWRCEVRGELCLPACSTMIHGSTKQGVMGVCVWTRLDHGQRAA
jgi:hypothetical protein